MKYLDDYLKIGLGVERLLFFMVLFIMLSHIMTCLWIVLSQFKNMTIDNMSWGDGYELYHNE